MRYLYFGSVRGDLQEGHVYAKRLRDYASRCQFPHFPSTKSGFLCSFTKLDVGVGALSRRQRHRRPCAAVVSAQPSYLRSRRICAAAVPSAVACSRLPPVPPVLPVLPPLHLLAVAPAQPLGQLLVLAVAPAQPILPQPTTIAPAGACGLGYHSGLGGGVEDVVD